MTDPPANILSEDQEDPVASHKNPHLIPRLTALFISILVALASGTLYFYGAYSPQLVKRVGLTTSDSATISLAMTLGSGIGGFPAGLIIDKYGPQLSICMGSIFIFINYFSIYTIYVNQYHNLFVLCLCMGFVGFGSIICFFATLKASQANFPKNRGTAGALPVSAYGFAATIFSIISIKFFSGDTGGLIRFLAFFCGSVTFFGSFFIHVYHEDDEEEEDLAVDGYIPVDNSELTLLSDQSLELPQMARTHSLAGSFSFWGIGERTPKDSENSSILGSSNGSVYEQQQQQQQTFLPNSIQSQSRKPSQVKHITTTVKKSTPGNPWHAIKQRMTDREFLTHYLITAITSGIGQMYIYSVGFIVTAQYYYNKQDEEHDKRAGGYTPIHPDAAKLQAIQVSIISIASFSGRLIAGFLSDFIHKRKFQRLWIVLVTIVLQALGQLILVLNVADPVWISISSGVMGSCYGLTFGTYPAIIADSFGTKTFSTNWGLICTGSVITLFVLNKYFGWIYDGNSDPVTRHCYKGNGCYSGSFELGMCLSGVAFIAASIIIWKHRSKE
ncbi:putative membrane protein [Spathaspora sp. JA1]|nr:putative membrane protein [Spathaspora sp. JA1]